MTLTLLRSAFAVTLAVTLAACGAGNLPDATYKTAAMMQINVPVSQAQAGSVTAPAYPVTSVQVANANMPQPDCAADGCQALRIIDANAEAFRYQAMQRAAAPQT